MTTLMLAEQIREAYLSENIKHIHINIDSPGGYVGVMLEIIDQIELAKEKGIKFTCLVTRTAASAAFLIFNTCDKRQVYETSMLMWHSVGLYIDGFHNIVTLRALLSGMEALQFWANEQIQANMKLDPILFDRLWTSEITLTGRELKELAPKYISVIKR